MSITGIDRITHGVDDLDACRRFFLDWGLKLVAEGGHGLDFETLNGCEVRVRRADDPTLAPAIEPGPTLREVIWAVESAADLDRLRPAMAARPGFFEADETLFCLDPNGVRVGLRVSRKRAIEVKGLPTNTWNEASRVDTPAGFYDRAEPIEVGHVVFFTADVAVATAFYESLGFVLSDRYPGRGSFLRCAERGGHHDLFLLQLPTGKNGLNHVAYTVRDVYEVFGGGLAMSRAGWKTQLGPGRHPVSSAFFWYFPNPAGALVEYYADEDVLTEKWVPRDFTPGPTVFAEWAIAGGIDGNTRRQAEPPPEPPADGAKPKFMTDRS